MPAMDCSVPCSLINFVKGSKGIEWCVSLWDAKRFILDVNGGLFRP